MTEKDNQSKPWEASFDDQPTQRYSRSQTRRRSQRVSMIVGILVAIIIALSFIPVYKYLQELNQPNNDSTGVAALSQSSTTKTSKVDIAASSSKAAAAKSASKKAASESSVAAAKAASSSSAAAASSSAAAASSSSANATAKFASGTLYSFARDNGTTPEALYALNPGLTATNYSQYYGQELKIK
ncbi:peptidoglycan-binding protein [Weissella oryzae SG25]|uniref:Peptidoglycan-binding protein n=1 Tax=Weissella oryzae (strain DSM 25784 / JCM 18191 / LMG 30913 / SG25) TaxID=1329250 RepID=A0A069CSI5_WEIOS|nr:LysM domain-containing protein [Weissella oryzae]GAK30439.1 peptidoglycan-binding protein [Weissella oryzae SG25]